MAAVADLCVGLVGAAAICGNSLAAARNAIGAGRRRIRLCRTIDFAGNSTLSTRVQHEITRNLFSVRGIPSNVWRDAGGNSCGTAAGERLYDADDVFSGAAALRNGGRSDGRGELRIAVDERSG